MNTRTKDKVLSRPNPQKLSCGCGLMAIKSGPAKAVPAVPPAPPLPEGHSINDGIDKELATVAYMSVDDAMAKVLRRGKGT